ncbi:MAG: hypothetical protein AAB907_00065 [Patescibacteria group bacterium]
MYIDDAGIVDTRKETISNTPTSAEELPQELEKEIDTVVPNGYVTLGTGLGRFYDEPMAKIVKERVLAFTKKVYATAHAVGRAEERKELEKKVESCLEMVIGYIGNDNIEDTVWSRWHILKPWKKENP